MSKLLMIFIAKGCVWEGGGDIYGVRQGAFVVEAERGWIRECDRDIGS
jgi:hypothetical protein